MTMWQIVFYGISSTVLIGTLALRPKLFWPMLIIVTVGTAGIMVGGQYTFLDEYLTGCILFGSLLAILVGRITLYKTRKGAWDQLHQWIFFLMVIYMIVQAFRGLIVLESLRKIRWVIYYGMLGILSFVISQKGFPVPNVRKLSLMISGSGLAYLILYLAHGIFTEVVRGISRFDVQPGEWSTSAYALFFLSIGIPSAIFLIKDRSYRYRRVGWVVLVAATLASFYYYSRVSLLVVLAFSFVLLFKLGIRKVIFIIFSVLVIFSLYSVIGNVTRRPMTRANDVFRETLRSTQSIRFWDDSSKTDVDRKVHVLAGFSAVTENWRSFLFGYGFRTHGVMISPHLKRLYKAKRLPHLARRVRDDESTEGFTALLVDTGLIGMLLLGMNFLFVAHKIFVQKRNPHRTILLLSLLFTFLWLPVINMIDIMLFYLTIMPNGLLVQLSGYTIAEGTT